MHKTKIILIICFFLSGCHFYNKGLIINTSDQSFKIIIKPSLISYYDSVVDIEKINKLNTINLSSDESEFVFLINPSDTLKIENSNKNIFYSPLLQINYLKVKRNDKDVIVLNNKGEIRQFLKKQHKNSSQMYFILDVKNIHSSN